MRGIERSEMALIGQHERERIFRRQRLLKFDGIGARRSHLAPLDPLIRPFGPPSPARGEGAPVHPPPSPINRITALNVAFSEAVTMLGSIPTPCSTWPEESWIST